MKANKTHYKVGKNIRDIIIKNGNKVPEKLLIPIKSLKQIEKRNNK